MEGQIALGIIIFVGGCLIAFGLLKWAADLNRDHW